MGETKKDIKENKEETEEDVEEKESTEAVEEKEGTEEPTEEAAEEPKEETGELKKDSFGRTMYPVKCSDCGKETEVPFKPSGDRPVYCRECFQRHRPRRNF